MDKKRISENTDITEHERLEIALRDREESLNAAQRLARVGSWQWDLRAETFSMSDEALRIHGLPPGSPPADVETVMGSLVHADDQAMLYKIMEDILAGGESRDVSFRIVRPDGEIRWLAATGHTVTQREEDGRPAVLMGAVQDVTEQRTARIALQQSEEKYRAVVESAGEAICTLNAEGVFLFMNVLGAQRLGSTPDEVVGKTLWDVFPKEFADQEATHAREAITSGKSNLSEAIVPIGDEMRWYQISMEPLRDHDGEVRSALVFARDVTERKQAEEALKIAHMKLMTARDEERKHLASELHDSVSQKLVALGMRLDNIALTGAKLPAEQGSELVKAAVTCNELIADIKGICHGLYPPALQALGLVSAMKELEGYCQSAGLTAAIHCNPVIARARFGPEVEIALFRIVQEAVNNAIRHSHGGNIDIDLMFAGGQLVLAIVDDGGGFDMQAVEGKGLGLSSMRDRARAVGARLTIASEPGETRIEVAVAVSLEETNGKKGE